MPDPMFDGLRSAPMRWARWRRWWNGYRLQYASDDGVDVEFYRRRFRGDIVVTRVTRSVKP